MELRQDGIYGGYCLDFGLLNLKINSKGMNIQFIPLLFI